MVTERPVERDAHEARTPFGINPKWDILEASFALMKGERGIAVRDKERGFLGVPQSGPTRPSNLSRPVSPYARPDSDHRSRWVLEARR